MMTDPMKPLGLSLFQLTALPPMHEAGGRLFVDVTQRLASPASRAGLLELIGKSDPLIRDALETVLERDGFIPSLPDEGPGEPPAGPAPAPIETDPAIVAQLTARNQASIAALKRDIRTKSGSVPRLHPGGHPGVEADPVRSAKPSGVHVGDGGYVVAQ
jgi:pyruvate,water dikinase